MSIKRLTVPALFGILVLGGCEQGAGDAPADAQVAPARPADALAPAKASAPPPSAPKGTDAQAATESREGPQGEVAAREGTANEGGANPVATSDATPAPAEPKTAAAPPPAPAEPPAAPAEPVTVDATMAFDEMEHDFGEMWDFESREHRFAFVNTGTDTLIVKDIKTSCGCTAAELEKKEYAPGEGSEIEVIFSPKDRSGGQTKVVTVLTNNDEQNPIQLRISARVQALVSAKPARLEHRGTLGTPGVRKIEIVSQDPDLEVTGVRINGTAVTARVLGRESGPVRPDDSELPPILVEVEVSDTAPWGETSGTVLIDTLGHPPDLPEVKQTLRVPVHIATYGQLTAEPDNFRFGVVQPGQKIRKVIRLTRGSSEPFKILSAKVERSNYDGLAVHHRPIEEEGVNGYDLIVDGGNAPKEHVALAAMVAIRTDVPGEEELHIRCAGVVRP